MGVGEVMIGWWVWRGGDVGVKVKMSVIFYFEDNRVVKKKNKDKVRNIFVWWEIMLLLNMFEVGLDWWVL